VKIQLLPIADLLLVLLVNTPGCAVSDVTIEMSNGQTGGASATSVGGGLSTGGATASATATAGSNATGSVMATGGSTATGGVTAVTATGGMAPTGGAKTTGGGPATGGTTGTGASPSWYKCDCSCSCSLASITSVRGCVNPSSANCSSCAAVCTNGCSSDVTFGTYVSGSASGSCKVSNIPVQWSCKLSQYGTGDGCDCGCGAVDPDCTSAAASACDYCAGTGSCASSCAGISATNNATCTGVPAGWHCAPSFYGSGDGCDCGCGVVDPDCTSSAASACAFCGNGGSCTFSCSTISATNNALCQ